MNMKFSPDKCKNELLKDLNTLRILDDKNQNLFSSSRSNSEHLSIGQMHLLTEALFFAAFRSYEQFLRNIFLLYCCGHQTKRKKLVKTFLNSRSIEHAEILVKSSMPFLDWSSPDNLIDRSEIYLKDGYPIKLSISTNLGRLRELKRIRNHIAHMSNESLSEYKKVVKNHFSTLPLKIPRPGEFLLLTSRRNSSTYYLRDYFQVIEDVANSMI